MGQAGHQFGVLLWKNWLCRLRHPVLSLAEFFWPCILFMILTVLRFQEPPRHRDTCYLQPRDLPSRGVFPFVQGLLCNTGSRCSNVSYIWSEEHHFRSPRFSTAECHKVNDLTFLKELQDLAEDVYELMDKAENLQNLWVQRSETPDSSYGSSFLTMDLNKTEEVILALESLHRQPHIWDFLLLLPRLYVNSGGIEDGIHEAVHLLQVVLNSLTSLEDLDWLSLNHTFTNASKIVINATISMLTFLQEHGMTAAKSGYIQSLHDMVWDPQTVQADLKSQFGFDDLRAEQVLNYSTQLHEIPTESSLEQMVCSALSHSSDGKVDREGRPGGCHPRWSEVKNYLVHAVSWLKLYKQVAHRWQKMLLAGVGWGLEAISRQFEEESQLWRVTEALHTSLVLLNDTLSADDLKGSHTSPQILLHLQKLQDILQNLPQWPTLKRLLQFDEALRNVIAQNLHFFQEVLFHLETSAKDSKLPGYDHLKLEKEVFFWELKQLLMKNATAMCLNGWSSEREAFLNLRNSSVWEGLLGLMCHHYSFNETSVFNTLRGSVEDADHLLQEVISGHANMPVSISEEYLGWEELEKQLLEVSLSCYQLFQLLGADVSPGNSIFPNDCKDQLIAIVFFHIFDKVQSSLKQTNYWKTSIGFIRKTCEVFYYANMQCSQNNPAFYEKSPCYEENMDWKFISDNYFLFVNNLLKFPRVSITRVLNSTKELLKKEKKLHTLEDEQIYFLLSFVEFWEKLLLPKPLNLIDVPTFHNLPSVTETILNTSHLWINHLKKLEGDLSVTNNQNLLEFSKVMIKKIQQHLWIREESRNIFRFIESILFEIDPKLPEFWMYGFSKGERMKLENLSTLLNFSVPYETILGENFKFSQLFHSNWSRSPTMKIDFVQFSETIINNLYELGFLRQEHILEALDMVYTLKNASYFFFALSEPQKQELGKIITYIYINVLKDKDSVLLLQIYSSLYQHIYKFLSIQNRESLLSFLTEISKHILNIIKQFNFQNIGKAFAFLYETTSVLWELSEVSFCQQLLSIFNFLENQAQSLVSTEGPILEVIHTALTGLKQLFIADKDFRSSLFQYMSQLFNGSIETLFGNECFTLGKQSIFPVNYSVVGGSSFILPWVGILSNFSTNDSVLNEIMTIHCTVSWLQMWIEIWENISHTFKLDIEIFTTLHVGLTQLLDELEGDMKISKSCQGTFLAHNPARLILKFFKNVTQADGFHDWYDFLNLKGLWVALDDLLIRVKLLNEDQVEKSLSSMENVLNQVKAFPLNINASQEFLYPLLDIFIKLSNTSDYVAKNAYLRNHSLSNNITDYGVGFQSVITELRKTIIFLRNLSHDPHSFSCVDIFQNVTDFILKDGPLYVNTSQSTLQILGMLKSEFTSEDTVNKLKGCIEWVNITNHLFVMCNSSVLKGHLEGILRNFRDVENKINSSLKLIIWLLNNKPCFLNISNINCVNIYLKSVTDILNVILTDVLEQEKLPEFEIFSTLLNDSANQIMMIINNLTRDIDFTSQSNWKQFMELILKPTEMSGDIPKQFKNVWLHIVALGKEIQNLVTDLLLNSLENSSSSKTEQILNIFATSLKENTINSLGNLFSYLASYLAANLSHNFTNSSRTIPYEVMKTVALGIQLMRDLFISYMPLVHHYTPQDPDNIHVLKKVASFLRTFKKTDIDLLIDQLEQISESLIDFSKNISKLGIGNLGTNLLVGLMEKFVDSSHSWNVNHLLKLSYLFPKDDANTVVDVYYAIPHAVRLLQRVIDKNITEIFKDVYSFTLLHGINFSNITKKDFAIVIKTFLDTIELISNKPNILSEALTCLPKIWCRNHTNSGFQNTPKVEACNIQELMSSSFYSKVDMILHHLHLSPPEESQCSNESSQIEITRRVVCIIHELVDWNSILLELSEIFQVKIPLTKIAQEFWHKVLPFVSAFENQSNDSISEFCTNKSMKPVILKIIENLKNINFTKITSDENILDKIVSLSLNTILNINEGTEAFAQNNISLSFKKIISSLFEEQILEDSIPSLVSPLMVFLNANIIGNSLETLSNLIKKNETSTDFGEMWLELEQTMEYLSHDFSIRQLVSEVNKKFTVTNAVSLQNITLQLAHYLESLNSSSLKTLEIIKGFLLLTRNWFHENASENYSRMMQTILLMANESILDINLSTEDISNFLGYPENISKESYLDVDFLTHLLNQEQLINFSVIQFLLEHILINSINKLAGIFQQAALNASDTYLHIKNFINLTLTHTQSENRERIIFLPSGTLDSMEQLLKIFFSSSWKDNYESKITLLLKEFHSDSTAEIGFVSKDKMLEIQQLHQFPTPAKEDSLINIFSRLKDSLYYLISSSLGNQNYFDNPQVLKFMKDLFSILLRGISMEDKDENNLDFLTVVSQLLFHMNGSENLFKLNQDLRSALHLVRETSINIASLMDTLLNSPNEDFYTLYPILQEVILANLSDLLSFINSSFPLRNRATLEITKQLLDVISRSGEESHILEPLLEMSNTLIMLMRDSAEMRALAMSVNSTVKILKLAKKVSRKLVTIFKTHFTSVTNDTMKFYDTLYFILQQSAQSAVNKIFTLKKVDNLLFENISDSLVPFFKLTFGMIGVKPNISQESEIFNMSSSTFFYVNQSNEFSGILEEIAEFLTSMKVSPRDMGYLVEAFSNENQIFSMDHVNLCEEVLNCLIPINNIINQIDFLYLNTMDACPQDTKWERDHKVELFLDEMLSQNSTEIGAYLRTMIAFSLEVLWNNLENDDWNTSNILMTFVQHPSNFLKIIKTVVEISSEIKSNYEGDLSKALFLDNFLIPNITHQQFEDEIQIILSKIALLKKKLLLNNFQWINYMKNLPQFIFEIFINTTTGSNITSEKERSKKENIGFPYIFKTSSCLEKYLKGLIALTEYWQEVPLIDQSVIAMCQAFQQPVKTPASLVTLQKVQVLVLHVLTLFAENPFLTKDMLCAALSCRQGGIRSLLVSALQGVILVYDHYQEFEKLWSSFHQINCESLSRNLSSNLEVFIEKLKNVTVQDCECQPTLDTAQRLTHSLAQSLGKTSLSENPVVTFLSNFTVNEEVKVKDLIKNITKLTEELQSSIHITNGTINSILEANISHAKVLSSVLTIALSGRCDWDILHLLLEFPKDEKSWFTVKELCGLPASKVYSLVLLMIRNLSLRNVIYETLIPSEDSGLLSSLLDLISSLSQLLTKASHVLECLPQFLQALKIPALLEMQDFQQVSKDDQARSSVFSSFQSVMKMICKDQASFLSTAKTFIDLPRVNELLEDDKEKFNIPEDSTPFCMKLYQEILQFPNGALVWSFLKPVLHGKILYTPNTPEINKVIQKANYTFHFVDKLKSLSEILLKMSNIFQNSGSGQMINQLQETLRIKFIRNFIESKLHIDVETLIEKLQVYGGMLHKMFNHTGTGDIQFLGHLLVNLSSCVALNRFQAMDSPAILESRAHDLMKQNDFLASIIFNSSFLGKNLTSEPLLLPPHVTYTIRTSVLYSMRTDLVKNPYWKFHPQNLPADGFKYNYIFVPLQDMIERAIILVQTGQEATEPATQAQAIPYPCHTLDLFLNNVGFFFPLIMMLTWMVSVASMVRKLVYEREIQIEEYMRMMGVHPVIQFLAWFLENMAVLTISSAALAVILKTSRIFAHSNAFIIFLFLLNFGVSVVMLSYFLSAFFSQANIAALCASLVYMISFLPYIVLLVLHNQLSAIIQMFLCLLSTTAFGQGIFFVTFLEGQEAGIQWNNMYQAPEQVGMTFGWVCWMILFDSGLYFLCGWYFSNLIPGTFGLKKPWYFPFTTSYWKNICGFMEKKPCTLNSGLIFFNENFANKGSPLQNGEVKLEAGPPGVSLVSVSKEYEHHKAVQDLTLTFHSDQITALLGTNGAGKTTVISMLTGLYPPTSGTIVINGKNLKTDLSVVRTELGVCPQRDVLFDNLTVLEHLLLFASIKAPQWTPKELQQQVNKTLEDVELTQHQHKQTHSLSGGMKRKLSIGIAFIGTSRTVVLDEPTSGVDPCSRRSIWDILLKYREGRTVIFTTHHLDEAEALSDRVAVLQEGKLRCCGPPFCLTESYGQGLSLTLTKQSPVLEDQDLKSVACATSLIQSYIPQAFLKDSSDREMTYIVPKDADRTCFKGLFQALDQNLQRLHLKGYGISDTTLEEVFLMLLQDSKKQPDIAPGPKLEQKSHKSLKAAPGYYATSARTPLAQGGQLLLAQMTALLMKKFRRTLRAWKSTLSDLLLPVLFVALAMGLFMVRPLAVNFPPLQLTPGHYESTETYFFSSDSQDMDLAHMLLQKFGDQGLLCADLTPGLENSSCWHTDPFPHPQVQDSCGCLKCPNRSVGAPYLTNHLGHTLLNLSAFNLEEYLLRPNEKPRLGGWSFGVHTPEEVQGAHSKISKPKTLEKVWYNQKGFHSLPSYLNHLNNLILWKFLPPDVDWRNYGITVYSHPYGGALLNEDKILESIRQCGVALCIVLGFSILSASIGSSVVRDRVTGAKRLQHISGLGYRTYWFTTFLYDMVFYLVSVSLCVTIIVAFQLTAFTFRENLAATALLLALFGYATLPWMYLMSRIFSSSDVAFISYISLNFIFGLCTMLMTIMPRLLAIISKAQNLQNIYDVLKWVFTIFPQFCLGQGLIELCYNQIKYDLTHNFGIDSYVSPFEMNFLGWIFVQLASQGTILLLLRILLHWDLLQWTRGHSALQGTVTAAKDIDVEKEQMRVLKGRTDRDILVLCNLSKSYGSFFKKTTAVQDISLGIPRGECFGLLGANGAGKTTTFKILNGDIPPTSGHAIIRTPMGEDVDPSFVGRTGVRIGYCPQQDALDELLTGWEHLQYYCHLRGIPKPCIPEVAGDLVKRLHLEAHVDKLVATYSGGTKRKLSTALALLGKPDLLLLDEPSSGMDPCSKRYLWKTIMKEVQGGCAAVLTSHSMEECEALCTRLAIMINGSFRCLGSPQHIKDRFGDGYTVRVWLSQKANQHSAISDCLKLHFPGIQFKGQRLNLLEYHLPKRWACLADLFKVLENNKNFLDIKYYSINQTTLEQVFINFASEEQQTKASTLHPSADHYHLQHIPI
ncbi:PREDICTED: ATP-binding cassette sub-family A member 13 [Condylura cristata]|uniref:ATP-binding cassette sub-family A member 13 n=1 Tax=Condylura cristata TaxID=143302 RepID=UPI0003346A07|nr:PREDICTED: ATP-binding cassette sub-family A member 13 [Condylura cristata]